MSFMVRSSQCIITITPASPALSMSFVNADSSSSNCWRDVKILMSYPLASRSRSCLVTAFGSLTVKCRMKSAIACFLTSSPAAASVTAVASFGTCEMKLAMVVTPPASAALEPVV